MDSHSIDPERPNLEETDRSLRRGTVRDLSGDAGCPRGGVAMVGPIPGDVE
jgi:hypothetical protein